MATLDPFWSRLGVETPDATVGCSSGRCDTTGMEPVDVYCVEHERFLPLVRELGTRARIIVAVLVRTVLCGLVLLTAYLGQSVWLYLAAAAVGTVLVGLPLRLYRRTRWAAVGGWLLACALVLVLRQPAPATRRIAATIVLVAVLAVMLLAWSAMAAAAGRRLAGRSVVASWRSHAARWAGASAGSVAVVPAALVLYAALRPQPADWVLATVGGRRLVLQCAVGGAMGALTFAAVGGIVLGITARVRPARSPVPVPARPRRLTWTVDILTPSGPAAGTVERLYRVLEAFLNRVMATAVATARALANLVRGIAYGLFVAGIAVVNWVCRAVVATWRRIEATVAATGRVLGLAARLVLRQGPLFARVLLVPSAALASGAWAAERMAVAGTSYLLHGSIASLGAMLGYCAVVLVLTATVWLALCDLSPALRPAGSATWRGSLPSLARSASLGGANALLLLCVGGWTLGLPGTFGPGPIRVGWLTLASTAILLVAAVTVVVRRRAASGGTRRRAKRPAGAGMLPATGSWSTTAGGPPV
jgi:hypothetical protein